MKNTTKLLAASIAFASLPLSAANYAIEARGDAMGGVGVVSANFLTAPFYNPALVAIYRRNDDMGMITPSFGGSYNDPNDMKSNIDSVVDASNTADLDAALNKLDGNQANVELGGVVAFALPNQFVAANLFAKAYTESFATPNVYTTGSDEDKVELSTVEAVSIGVAEVGLSLAKYQTFMGQHISFGITPKIQRIYTYNYVASVNDYDLSDVRENSDGETAFNMDAGALWFFGPFRVGVAATNLISRDIETKDTSKRLVSSTDSSKYHDVGGKYTYQLEPVYTVGAGIVSDYFTLSVDYDLNETEKFTSFEDNEQMIRVGTEVDLLRQLKLRGGYYKNLAYSDSEGTVTAGIGISPLNLFQLDLSANYTNENAMGASINFLASY
ncbi:F plasmid transfer operon protein TraF [Vibrio crassostreae]|uniref:conjugal transfer protein TraF n=1 Tax=Vibrio crassostreae TaxID=246167 RepID=UPI000F4A8663|nr:conjugal transfer protein TraF [Vibrio crassostreae]ROO69465.1 F plasmid transfer operon protein TraF [Vibrio crassostreae]ROO70458.1 F plasmid transfer operon protein TraF [Vibrio crassostreae]ROP08612.1 F plasmid transfer operon protein TraF [Vibrio crassostreae]ROQ75513.1 F plasmid transfer operon protein TraF [Vibrio crassostreae]ROR79900.1 F plasmid transfer operon protein TraF [Vibrio crassostreae]